MVDSETTATTAEGSAEAGADAGATDAGTTDAGTTDADTTDAGTTDSTTAAAPAAEGSTDDAARNARKVREGMVTSTGMNKTIVVTVTDRVRHAKYNKFVLRTKKLYAHDEADDAGVGDRVRVMETRPMSKTKRWRLVEIIERAR